MNKNGPFITQIDFKLIIFRTFYVVISAVK